MLREFKTIICPTDFSDASLHALEYAHRFAQLFDGTILLMHVLHDPMSEEFRPGGHAISFEEVKKRAKPRLEQIARDKLGDYPHCELFVEVGDPHQEIVQMAEKRNADLIVISTHGRTGLDHLLIGSVAEKIVRHASCPVFVVRQGVD